MVDINLTIRTLKGAAKRGTLVGQKKKKKTDGVQEPREKIVRLLEACNAFDLYRQAGNAEIFAELRFAVKKHLHHRLQEFRWLGV